MPSKSARPARKTAAAKKSPQRAPAKRAAKAPATPEPAGSKQSRLIALLSTPAGATIEQMTTLTGWQPHSVRGMISGALRKRLKLNVTCVRGEDGVRVYRIGAA